MQGVIELVKGWELHPVVDHFTVALILVAILIDLVASLVPSRLWLRYMAATLMVLGAAAAAASNVTGGWEAHRVWDNLTEPAKELLKKHAWWGDVLPWVFGGLAVWRVGAEFLGFVARSRPLYLLAALAVGGAILYQGDLGGDLVYDYGVGTALMAKATPSATATNAAEVPAPIPTVYVPLATPSAAASPGAMATGAPASPVAAPSAGAPTTVPSSATTPSAPGSGGEVKPSPGAAASPSDLGSPGPKSTTL